jgi:DNA-binding LacI/PurR family transcriptional regulator
LKPESVHRYLPRAAKVSRSRVVTIRDVARKAGVSIGTVSRFLNGYALKEKTRSRVAQTIEDLGYRQNVIAKGMKSRRSFSVGVLFPIFDEFHTEILSALEKQFARCGYHMVVSQYEYDEHAMEDKLRFLKERFADGLILSPGGMGIGPELGRECRKLIETGVPVITFNNRISALENDHVHVNDAEAVQGAVEHLFNMNHKDIAILSGAEVFSTARERLTGYMQAMERHSVSEGRRMVMTGDWSSSASGFQLAKKMMSLPRKPTAVFSSNCILTFGLLEYLHTAGFRIPDDVSVISFDDPRIFRLHQPGIAAIRQPNEEIAKAVAELVIRRLSGDWSQFPIDQRIPTEFILRSSVRKR